MSLDFSSLLAQACLRKHQRPVAEQMLSIQVRDVRPLVELNQQTVRLPQMGGPLSLLWRWRSGGCLGPKAAAAMNARQRQARADRPAAELPLDRGATGGWHLDLICPVCIKPCRKLFSHGWSERIRPDARLWACRLCHRVTYTSSNLPGSSNNRRPPSYRSRKHTEAAIRIRRDFMGLDPEEAENIYFPPALLLVLKTSPKSSIHWERWEALRQLAMAHETLATLAWGDALNRYVLQLGLEPFAPIGGCWPALAEEQLRENSWATRQSSWHRRGRPRPGPEGSIR